MTQPGRPTLDELSRGEIDDADLAALARTAQLFDALDPVPAGLVDRIQFGLTLDFLHAEIAQLQRTADLTGVRSDANADSDVQTVTFTSSSLSTMVTITPLSVDRVRIDGWIAPGGGVSVELRIVGAVRNTAADADGRFVFDDVPRGFAQFVLRGPGVDPDHPIVTPSMEM